MTEEFKMPIFDQYPNPEYEFIERIFQIRRFGAEARISAEVWERATLQVKEDLFHDILIRLELKLLTEKAKTGTASDFIDFPATPWQHFKRDYAPVWLTKRYPVKYKRHTLTLTVTDFYFYPQAKIPIPEKLGYPVIYQEMQVNWSPDKGK